jgi:hypothetical protein
MSYSACLQDEEKAGQVGNEIDEKDDVVDCAGSVVLLLLRLGPRLDVAEGPTLQVVGAAALGVRPAQGHAMVSANNCQLQQVIVISKLSVSKLPASCQQVVVISLGGWDWKGGICFDLSNL